MYKTTVKTRKIIKGKKVLKIIAPFVIWVMSIFICLILIDRSIWVTFSMIVIFFLIIPICIYFYKSTEEFRGINSFENKEVTFNVINGELYVENNKVNVKKEGKELYVDNVYEVKNKFGKRKWNFCGDVYWNSRGTIC